MINRLRFIWNRLKENLWIRPLAMIVFSVGLVFLVRLADSTNGRDWAPEITVDTIETMLSIMASSMLVIATFSVASMVSAYASASNNATPRSFPLIIADDVSQNALSTFIGTFIFSIVALTAVKNSYYEVAGRFAIFCLTIFFFLTVILTFVRWVDRVARLGRLGNTIENVERTAKHVLKRRKKRPYLGGGPLNEIPKNSMKLSSKEIGYIQMIDMEALQNFAEKEGITIFVTALPGVFATPNRTLAHISADSDRESPIETQPIVDAFRVGANRTFDEDPRFALIVLSEIASRALSSAVNDPGSAIDVIGRMVRLLVEYTSPHDEDETLEPEYGRVQVAPIDHADLFEDCFSGLARDGAGTLEVAIRLQKALQTIAELSPSHIKALAKDQARKALAHAEAALNIPHERETLREIASLAD